MVQQLKGSRQRLSKLSTKPDLAKLITDEESKFAEALYNISTALHSFLNPTELIDWILANIEPVVPYDTADIMVIEANFVRVVGSRSQPDYSQYSLQGQHFFLPNLPALYQVFQSKESLIISDPYTYPDWTDMPQAVWSHSFICAPIWLRDRVIGFINLASAQADFYKGSHNQRLQVFADYAGIALHTRYSRTMGREQHFLSESLSRIGLSFNSILELPDLLDLICRESINLFNVDGAHIWLVRGDKLIGFAGQGVYHEKFIGQCLSLTEIQSVAVRVVKQLRPIVVNDAFNSNEVNLELTKIFQPKAILGVPLVKANKAIGALILFSILPGTKFSSDDIDKALALTNHAAIAIENAQLFDETRRQARQLSVLTELAREITEPLELTDLCTTVVHCLHVKLGWPHVAIFTIDTIENELILQANAGIYTNLMPLTNYRQSLYVGIAGRVARTGETVYANNVSYFPEFFQLEGMDLHSELATSLQVGDQVIGVLTVGSSQLNAFDMTDVATVKTVANQVAAALEKIRFFEETHRRAEQLDALSEVLQDLTVLRDSDTLLHQIAERAIQLLDADGCGIYLYRSEPKVLEAVVEILSPGNSPPQNDAQPEADQTLPLTDFGVSAVSVPIQAGTEPLGMLNVNADNRRRPFTQEDKDLLSQFASQAAIAIQNARLYTQIQHHAAQLEARVAERTFELQVLYELTQALGKTTQLNEVIRLILLHLYQAVPHDIAASLLVTNTNTTLVIQSQRSLTPQVEALIQEKMYGDLKQSLDNKPLNIHRIQSKGDIITRPPIKGLASLLQVPITVNETVIGLLLVATEQSNQFNEEQTQLLRTVADQAAEAIQRLQSLLAAEHQRLESLVAHLPNGVILLDSERHIILANPAARQYLDALNPTINGDILTHLAHHSVETILISSLSPPKGESSYIIEINGPPRQIYALRAEPIAVGPEAGGWLLVIWNETEARLAQDRIKQQERLAAVGQLAAGIAHDFNNILTSMIGFAELVRMSPDLSPLIREDLQRIINQGQRAAGLVRQILDFSRQSITEKRPIDILPFLKETIKLLERTIPENIRIILEVESPKNTYIINADPTQLQQVLTNLAVNARDVMPSGGILHFNLSTITLALDERPPYPEMPPGNWIRLSISDNGFGITLEVLPHIFEPFFTTKEVGKGTGLGLAQAHGIITQHGGFIDVETEVGKGTTFTLYLPAIFTPAKNPVPPPDVETNYGHGELILLVEDDPDVLEVTHAMLKSLRYQVVTAINGHHAQEIFDQHKNEISLVLTDVTMPEMGGLALAQALREKEPQVKIIALTGYPLETESKDLLSQGIVDWLQKPLNRHELAQIIKQTLNLE